MVDAARDRLLRVTAWPRPETTLLFVLSVADMVSTALLVLAGHATEANPLLALPLRHSVAAFCATKLLFTVPSLLLAEWYRRYNERLVTVTLRGVVLGYLLLYGAGFLITNG